MLQASEHMHRRGACDSSATGARGGHGQPVSGATITPTSQLMDGAAAQD